jgi:hypothetical protein
MKTLSELNREEQARRDRAAEYESLLGSAARLRTTVQRLSDQRLDVSALQQIHALCGDVPSGLVTRGTMFMPGGFSVRDTLMRVAGDAVAAAQQKGADVESALTKAKADLKRVEDALEQFK